MTITPPPATLGATGLPAAAIAAIQAVLASHPQVERAVLYGSRALVRQREASDIDLTLIGSDLNNATLARIDVIYDTTLMVLERAAEEGIPPSEAADRLAEEKIRSPRQ